MKSHQFYHIVFFIIIFFFFNEYSFCQTKTVTYNIPDWNKSGSFTFTTGSSASAIHGESSGFISIKDSDGKIIFEINPKTIDEMISNIMSVEKNLVKDLKPSMTINNSTDNIISTLNELKSKLTDPQKLNNLIENMNNQQRAVTTLNWSKILSTIRNQQITVTGTIN